MNLPQCPEVAAGYRAGQSASSPPPGPKDSARFVHGFMVAQSKRVGVPVFTDEAQEARAFAVALFQDGAK